MPETTALTPELQQRADEAAVAEAEAKAAQARAAASKAAADARAAELAAEAAARSNAEYDPVLAREEQLAASQKTIAEADLEAAKARRDILGGLIPDLSAVEKSSLTIAGEGPAIGSTALSLSALQRGGSEIAAEVGELLQHAAEVLVTSELDLVTSDAAYWEVTTGMSELITAIDELPEPQDLALESLGAMDAVSALASAIPGVLSLLSAQRNLATAAATPSDIAVTASVVGALRASHNITVVHDLFRLVPDGPVFAQLKELNGRRNVLKLKQVKQAETVRLFTATCAEATAAMTAISEEITKLKKAGEDTREARERLAAKEVEVAKAQARSSAASALLAAMNATAGVADQFVAAIRASVPGGRSLLAAAALREEMHRDGGGFTHVLFLKAESGQVEQVTTNMPLWFKDRFTTSAFAAVTYLLLETARGTIAGAGTKTQTATATGKVGERLTIV